MAHDRIMNDSKGNATRLSPRNRLRLSFFFGFASLGAWMPTLTVWYEDNGLPKSQMGYMAALPWLVMLVVQPVWGIIADRTGKQRCMLATTVTAAIVFVFFPVAANNTGSMIAMTLIMALFNTPVLPLLDSISLDMVASGAIPSYASFRFWGAPGFAAGALLASWLVGFWSVDAIFYLAAFFLFLLLLMIAGLKSGPQATAEAYSTKGITQLLKDKLLIVFMLVIVLVSVAQSSSSFYLTVYLREIGATSGITGTALAVQALSELPFYFLAAWLLKRTTADKIVLIAIFGTAVRLGLYALNTKATSVIGIELLNGITWTLLWIAAVDYVDHRVNPAWRTTGQSLLWAAYYGAGAIAGNILSGRLYEVMPMRNVYGINSALATAAGIIAVIAFVVVKPSNRLLKTPVYNEPNT